MNSVVDRIVPKNEVKFRIGNPCESTFARMVKEGRFPPPVRISPRRLGWLESVVSEWIKNQSIKQL